MGTRRDHHCNLSLRQGNLRLIVPRTEFLWDVERSALRCLKGAAYVATLLVMVSCSGGALRWEPDTYTVKRGDTLYSIAWRHGLDYRELARWNRLENQDLIHPGQVLTLRGPAHVGVPPARGSAAPPKRTATTSNAKPGHARTGNEPAPKWVWPTNGQLLTTFQPGSTQGGKGIKITGVRGQPVRAAANGKVVYSGSGLIGYGQLIIVKHNNTYLSAYGHNDALLVAQGDVVKAGQNIARMGVGPEKRPVLHFEIRLNGEPVDPIRYLPR